IKRVEILSALQERYPGLPAPPPDRLGAFHTLRDIAEFLGGAVVSPSAPATAAPPEPDPTADLARVLPETVPAETGHPAEVLELEMRLDDDLGIDSIKRVEIFSALQERYPGMPPATPEQIGILGTLRDIVNLLAASTTTATEKASPQPEGMHGPATIVDDS